jgi:hypothetical protein
MHKSQQRVQAYARELRLYDLLWFSLVIFSNYLLNPQRIEPDDFFPSPVSERDVNQLPWQIVSRRKTGTQRLDSGILPEL